MKAKQHFSPVRACGLSVLLTVWAGISGPRLEAQENYLSDLLPEKVYWNLQPTDFKTDLLTPDTVDAMVSEEASDYGVFFKLLETNLSLSAFLSVDDLSSVDPADLQGDYFLLSPTFTVSGNGDYVATAKLKDNTNQLIRVITVSSPADMGEKELVRRFWNAVDQPIVIREEKMLQGRDREPAVAVRQNMAINAKSQLKVFNTLGFDNPQPIQLPRGHNRIETVTMDGPDNPYITWGVDAPEFVVLQTGKSSRLKKTATVGLPAEYLTEGVLRENVRLREVKFLEVVRHSGVLVEGAPEYLAASLKDGSMTLEQAATTMGGQFEDYEFFSHFLNVCFYVEEGTGAAAYRSLVFGTYDPYQKKWLSTGQLNTARFQRIDGGDASSSMMDDPGRNLNVRFDPAGGFWAFSAEGSSDVYVARNAALEYSAGKGNWHSRSSWEDEMTNLLASGYKDFDTDQARDLLCTVNPRVTAMSLVPEDEPAVTPSGGLPPVNVKTGFRRIGWKVVDFEFIPNGRGLAVIWERETENGKIDSETVLWDFRSDEGVVAENAQWANGRPKSHLILARREAAKGSGGEYAKIIFSPVRRGFQGEFGHGNVVSLLTVNGGYELFRYAVRALPPAGDEATIASDFYFAFDGEPGRKRIVPVAVDYDMNRFIEGDDKVKVYQLYKQEMISF